MIENLEFEDIIWEEPNWSWIERDLTMYLISTNPYERILGEICAEFMPEYPNFHSSQLADRERRWAFNKRLVHNPKLMKDLLERKLLKMIKDKLLGSINNTDTSEIAEMLTKSFLAHLVDLGRISNFKVSREAVSGRKGEGMTHIVTAEIQLTELSHFNIAIEYK